MKFDFDARTFPYANIGQMRHVGIETEVGAIKWKRVRPSVSYVLAHVRSAQDPASPRQIKNVPNASRYCQPVDGPAAEGRDARELRPFLARIHRR